MRGIIVGLMSLVSSGCCVNEAERKVKIEEYEIFQHLKSNNCVSEQFNENFTGPVLSEPEVTITLTRMSNFTVYQIESDIILTPEEMKKYVDEFRKQEREKLQGSRKCGDPKMAPWYHTNIFGNGVVTFRDCPADMRAYISYCGGNRELPCINRLAGVADFLVPKYVRKQFAEMNNFEIELYAIDGDGNRSATKSLIVNPENYELIDAE